MRRIPHVLATALTGLALAGAAGCGGDGEENDTSTGASDAPVNTATPDPASGGTPAPNDSERGE